MRTARAAIFKNLNIFYSWAVCFAFSCFVPASAGAAFPESAPISVPAASRADLERLLAEAASAPAEGRAAAHEKLRKYIESPAGASPESLAVVESAVDAMIESDIRDGEAHATAGEVCLKKGNVEKARYHFEMAVMAAPYNFHARRKLNEIRLMPRLASVSSAAAENAAPAGAASSEEVSASRPAGPPVQAARPAAEAPADEESGDAGEEAEKLSSTIRNNLPPGAAPAFGRAEPESAGAQECKRAACYYIKKKDLVRAADFARRALEQEPADNEANYIAAFIAHKRKKNDEAFMYLNMINPETLSDARLLHDAGVLLVRLGKNDEAAMFFTNGIACDRAYLENYISLAVRYTQIKDYDSAAKYFKEALEVSPGDVKTLYFYALSCNKAGRYEEFVALADRLLRTAPDGPYAKMIKRRLGLMPTDRLISGDNEKTLLNVAIEYFNSGDYSMAESKLKEIIRMNPDSFDANLYLAKSSKNAGKTVEYAYYLSRLNSARPNIAIELELARAFAALGLNVLSRESYLKYINRNPADVAVKLEYARMLAERGARMSARVMGETILRGAKSPEELEAANLALAEINAGGDADTAETEFCVMSGEAAENLYKLCLTLHENEMYAAVEAIGAALTANAVDADARVLEMYAFSLTALKKYNRAADVYRLMIARDRSNYNAYVQLGRIYLKRNNFVRAEEYFRAASVFRPEDAEILMLLGDSCYYQKNVEDAELAYREALERAPNAAVREEIKLKLDKIKFGKRAR